MKFETVESGAFIVIVVGIIAAISAVVIISLADSRVMAECHKAQRAAYAASAPAPDCKK